MDKIVETLKAASDPTRIRILMSLLDRELCVCQITELLELAVSTVSKHMSILKHAGFVKSRKEGKWIYYRINKDNEIEGSVLYILINNLKNDKLVKNDKKRLSKILAMDQNKLCRKK